MKSLSRKDKKKLQVVSSEEKVAHRTNICTNVPRQCLDPRFSVEALSEVEKSALRRGVWFRSLSRVERGIIDLTVRYVDNVKSSKLAKVLTAIISKLESAMESIVDRLVDRFLIFNFGKVGGR